LTEPTKYIPRVTKIEGVKKSFEVSFPPFSISVLRVKDMGYKNSK
jgi:hypothetical protein